MQLAYPPKGPPDEPLAYPSKIFFSHPFHLIPHYPAQRRRPQHFAVRTVFQNVHDQLAVVGVRQAQQVAAVAFTLAALLGVPLLLRHPAGALGAKAQARPAHRTA